MTLISQSFSIYQFNPINYEPSFYIVELASNISINLVKK